MGFRTYAAQPAGVGSITSPGSASQIGPGGWHPTVLYMLGLVVLEIIIVGFLSRHVLK
jgi:hypothetical protein